MTRIHLSAGTLLFCFLISCGESFLDVKADQTQRVPETIQDYMSIMDNTSSNTNPMNIRSSHTLGIIGGDEYYIPEQNYETFPTGLRFDYQKNAYTWNSRVYIGGEGGTLNPTDFETGYQRILRANLVLDGLDRIDPSPADQEAWDHTKGTALFHRAWNYYCLLQLYCLVYSDATSSTDMGMPLRTEADPTLKVPRASVSDCYELIIQDLMASLNLLPESPLIKFRPGRVAALALLARIYLQMERYDLAVEYASRCIGSDNQLLDYNTIGTAGQPYPFPTLGTENPEVIFVMTAFTAQAYSGAFLAIGKLLYESYAEGDLRKELFFEEESSGVIRYRGSYYGSELLFTGLALDEIYLIRAESRLRTGDIQGG